jgi:hypothetical protein
MSTQNYSISIVSFLFSFCNWEKYRKKKKDTMVYFYFVHLLILNLCMRYGRQIAPTFSRYQKEFGKSRYSTPPKNLSI